MIFYHQSLMPTDAETTLFSVLTSRVFAEFEDHQTAINSRITSLVEQAQKQGENPQMLIEDYLSKDCEHCCSASEIAWFLSTSDPMQYCFNKLAENWNGYEPFLAQREKADSQLQQQALQIYMQTDLRAYLEAVATIYPI